MELKIRTPADFYVVFCDSYCMLHWCWSCIVHTSYIRCWKSNI